MRQVGNAPQALGHLGLEPAEPLFFVGDRRLQALALVDQGRPLLGIALAAGGLGDLVLAAADLFDGLKQAAALAFERDHAIDVIEDVGRNVAIAAVLFDGLGIGDDEFQIEHEHTFDGKHQPNSPVARIRDQPRLTDEIGA